MCKVKVVSLDLEGTLVDQNFSDLVWNEGIPRLYAEEKGLSFPDAKKIVLTEYEKVGDRKIEWYDIRYWFKRFELKNHSYEELMNSYKDKIFYYPEVKTVLEELSKKYVLILTSNSAREFLEFLVGKFEKFFSHTFSATSDFKCVKKDKEFYLKICKILDKKPEEISHVGDRWEDDFLIPREIGIKAFYLDRSGKRRDKFTVKDLKEFMDKLEGGLHV